MDRSASSLGPVTSMTVNLISVPISAVSNENGVQQINFQTPCEVQPGPATVVITINGVPTTIPNVQVLASQPGIFTFAGPNGIQYGAVIRAADGTYVSTVESRKPRRTLLHCGHGTGPNQPARFHR